VNHIRMIGTHHHVWALRWSDGAASLWSCRRCGSRRITSAGDPRHHAPIPPNDWQHAWLLGRGELPSDGNVRPFELDPEPAGAA
jgi:hypothetical protein